MGIEETEVALSHCLFRVCSALHKVTSAVEDLASASSLLSSLAVHRAEIRHLSTLLTSHAQTYQSQLELYSSLTASEATTTPISSASGDLLPILDNWGKVPFKSDGGSDDGDDGDDNPVVAAHGELVRAREQYHRTFFALRLHLDRYEAAKESAILASLLTLVSSTSTTLQEVSREVDAAQPIMEQGKKALALRNECFLRDSSSKYQSLKDIWITQPLHSAVRHQSASHSSTPDTSTPASSVRRHHTLHRTSHHNPASHHPHHPHHPQHPPSHRPGIQSSDIHQLAAVRSMSEYGPSLFPGKFNSALAPSDDLDKIFHFEEDPSGDRYLREFVGLIDRATTALQIRPSPALQPAHLQSTLHEPAAIPRVDQGAADDQKGKAQEGLLDFVKATTQKLRGSFRGEEPPDMTTASSAPAHDLKSSSAPSVVPSSSPSPVSLEKTPQGVTSPSPPSSAPVGVLDRLGSGLRALSLSSPELQTRRRHARGRSISDIIQITNPDGFQPPPDLTSPKGKKRGPALLISTPSLGALSTLPGPPLSPLGERGPSPPSSPHAIGSVLPLTENSQRISKKGHLNVILPGTSNSLERPNWRRIYLYLQLGLLFYYDERTLTTLSPYLIMDLRRCCVVESMTPTDDRLFCFAITDSVDGRWFTFQAESQRDHDSWVADLRLATEEAQYLRRHLNIPGFLDLTLAKSLGLVIPHLDEVLERRKHTTSHFATSLAPIVASYPNSVKMHKIIELWNIDGNGMCADCGAPCPDWACLNFGIFVCFDCACKPSLSLLFVIILFL